MWMNAAVLSEPHKPLKIERVQLDEPKAREILVKMVASGVCHSDVHVFTGDLSRPFPVIPGHEGAGIVERVGEGVTTVAPGDKVILTYLPACGKCRWCHTGFPSMCDLGGQLRTGKMLDGTARLHRENGEPISNFLFVSTWAEYSVCPEDSVVKVPEYIDLTKACLFGCGFTTGYGAATRAVHIRPGESVVVVGCGGLGLAAIQGARASNAGKIIAIDLHDEKLAMAKQFGATHLIRNTHDVDAVIAQVMDITWGVGSDYSFEFVGTAAAHQETFNIAFRAIRKGGTFVLCGVGFSEKAEIPIDPAELTLFRKQVKGVLFGDAQFRADIPLFVNMYHEGQIRLDSLVTHEYEIGDINTTIENVLAENRVGRQIIRFDT